MPKRSLDEVAEKVKEELAEFEIGGQDLDVIFDPLVQQCMELSRNDKEFKQCIEEAISTLKSIVKKVR